MTAIQTLYEQKIETFWVTQTDAKNVDIHVHWMTMAGMGEVVQSVAVELSFFSLLCPNGPPSSHKECQPLFSYHMKFNICGNLNFLGFFPYAGS